MSTPHIESERKDISNIVLMPGDPLRAKYIAQTYLTDYKLVNSVRNITAYSGFYKNKYVTIFPSGIGVNSMGIYSHELYNFYDVSYIIRIGSFGSYNKDINLYDLVLVDKSYSNSNYGKEYCNYDSKLISSSKKINDIIISTSKELNYNLKYGNIHTVSSFYNNINIDNVISKYKCLGAEMETYSLFINAQKSNKYASSILTCSDKISTKEELSSVEREKHFEDMILLALESILKL